LAVSGLAFAQGTIPREERDALIAFYISTGGSSWDYGNTWLGAAGTEATWIGVKVEGGHVTRIVLHGQGVTGDIPAEIGRLSYLEVFDLGPSWVLAGPMWENLVTSLPPEIGQLSRLRSLLLGRNRLTALPQEIGDLAALTQLDVGGNLLTSIPPTVGRLARLTDLDLSVNLLTSIPASIGSLSALVSLNLFQNRLMLLPPELGNLTNLEELYLSSNPLDALPPEMGNLTRLTDLTFGGGNLAKIPQTLALLPSLTRLGCWRPYNGVLPSGIGSLKTVKELWVRGGLRDASEVSGMTGLVRLDLSGNTIASLPPDFGQLKYLQVLDLYENKLAAIPPVIGELGSLVELDLGENPLSGTIPATLGNLSHLKELRLTPYDVYLTPIKLTGQLPPEMGNMTSLEVLELEGDFTGPIPPEFGRLKNLRELRLYGKFSTLPAEIGSLGELRVLEIRGAFRVFPYRKAVFPVLPREIGALSKLQTLELAGAFTAVPAELYTLTQLYSLDLRGEYPMAIPSGIEQMQGLVYLTLRGLEGQIPSGIFKLGKLKVLNLSENRLSGSVPPELGEMESLESLHLNDNRLEGRIPSELGNIETLGYLGLSRNRLDGAVPPEIFRHTGIVDLSSNKLVGRLPDVLSELVNSYGWVNFKWNALYPVGLDAFAFISRHHMGDFGGTQSYGPVDLTAVAEGSQVRLSWSPISYTSDSGGYEILYRKDLNAPFTVYATTPSKTASSFTVSGLETGVQYQFALRTVT